MGANSGRIIAKQEGAWEKKGEAEAWCERLSVSVCVCAALHQPHKGSLAVFSNAKAKRRQMGQRWWSRRCCHELRLRWEEGFPGGGGACVVSHLAPHTRQEDTGWGPKKLVCQHLKSLLLLNGLSSVLQQGSYTEHTFLLLLSPPPPPPPTLPLLSFCFSISSPCYHPAAARWALLGKKGWQRAKWNIDRYPNKRKSPEG